MPDYEIFFRLYNEQTGKGTELAPNSSNPVTAKDLGTVLSVLQEQLPLGTMRCFGQELEVTELVIKKVNP